MLSAIRRPVFNTRFLSTLVKSMEKHEIVPDVIDVAPQEVAEVNNLLIRQKAIITSFCTGYVSLRGKGEPGGRFDTDTGQGCAGG